MSASLIKASIIMTSNCLKYKYGNVLTQVIHCMNCCMKTTILFLPIFICITCTRPLIHMQNNQKYGT